LGALYHEERRRGIILPGAMAQPARPHLAAAAEIAVALAGAALLLFCWQADLRWFDRHLLQSYFTPRHVYVRMAVVNRWGAGFLGVMLLVFVRPLLGRWVRRQPPRALARALLRAGLLLLCAALLAEGALRLHEVAAPRWRGGHCKLEVRMGRRDPRYGWTFVPSRTAVVPCSGRDIAYAFDALGNRAPAPDRAPDPALPSILFAGESIVVGQGLRYEETFPALLAARTGLQAVNVAVHGYGLDQAYLRLIDALPRYRRPVAVVTLFLPEQLDRPLRDVRPHLVLDRAGGLVLAPADAGPWGLRARLRLAELTRSWVRAYGEGQMAQLLAVAAAIMRDTARRARERGARPLFVIPSFGPPRALDAHPEAWIVRRVFADQGLPHLLIDLDPGWTLPGDGHPDPRAALHIAAAIEAALR
jgi:hypothetical protein